MEDRQKIELLQAEYLHIQRTLEEYDSKALNLKIWATSVTIVLLGFAFFAQNEILFILPPLTAAIFWLIEIQWKNFQYAHYERAGKIESYFAGNLSDIQAMQIGEDWYKSWKKGGISRFLKTALRSHVILPHALLLLIGILPFILGLEL
ncbi:MAG: hypothetical protein R8P61_03305 [Bacteroidia bacterium]|nr:hypothetical protein [Bacteroidia bacterium]